MDNRQNVLTTINNLLKKFNFIQNHPEDKHFNRFILHAINQLELLRNDLVLMFNQTFYLRCKLDQKNQQIQTKDKKIAELTSRMNLTLDMTKQRYEKQIQALRFSKFTKNDLQQGLAIAQNNDKGVQSVNMRNMDLTKEQSQQYKIQQSTHQSSTIKKGKQFLQLKFTPSKDAILFPEYIDKKQEPQNNFDLEFRGGLMSQQKPLFSNNRVNQEMVKSNQLEEHHSKKRRGRSTNTKKEEQQLNYQRKKKSEQLADLVAQQFKVAPIKQKYFSTDLL